MSRHPHKFRRISHFFGKVDDWFVPFFAFESFDRIKSFYLMFLIFIVSNRRG